jgi:lysyl-tRNA synthetase class 2
MLDHTEALLRELAHFIAVTTADPDVESEDIAIDQVKLPWGDSEIDYGSPFARFTYSELFEKALGFPLTDTARACEEAKKRGLKHEGLDDVFIINELFEEVAEPIIDPTKPTFVTEYPAPISPLTRPLPDNPNFAGRWDLFIGGMEIGTAYTELNDPDVQIAKFQEQLTGADEEEQAFRTMDEDFIEALKVGMPPAGGLGLGIDRIVMLMTNNRSIRDVILFPFMRPA